MLSRNGVLLVVLLSSLGFLSADSGNSTAVLNMCVILERGSYKIIANYDKVAAAIDMGLDFIHDDVLPKQVRVKKIFRDAGSTCRNNRKAAFEAISLFREGIVCDVYLGPGCSDQVTDIYNVASYTGTPQIAIPAGGITNSLLPRSSFPGLARLSYRLSNIAYTIVKTLQLLSFVHTYVLVDGSVDFYPPLNEILFDVFKERDPDFLRYTHYQLLEDGITDAQCSDYLRDVQKRSRAVILLTGGRLTRRLMYLSIDLGMTKGDYLYIAIELFESLYWGVFTWRGNDGRDDEIRTAYDNLLLIALNGMDNEYYPVFAAAYVDKVRKEYGYNFTVETQNGLSPVDATVSTYFDAVVFYGSTLRRVLESGQSVHNNSAVVAAMKSVSFYSPISNVIKMDANGDRELVYVVQDVLPQGQYDNILFVNGSSLDVIQNGNFHWPTGRAPVDVPYCGFLGDHPRCASKIQTHASVGTVMALGGMFLLGIGIKFYLRRRSEADPFWWRISNDEIDFVPIRRPKSASTAEIPIKPSYPSLGSINGSRLFHPPSALLLADYRGTRVQVRQFSHMGSRPNSAIVKEMNTIKSFHHNSLLKFIGICLNEQGFIAYCVEECSEKGTLRDLLANQSVILDDVFSASFARGISDGMNFLHSSVMVSHGFLRSTACHVNGRFLVRISDYGLPQLRDSVELLPPKMSDDNRDFYLLLYRPPELLRVIMPRKGTQKGDVYSFGILLQEIVTRSKPFLIPSTTAFHASAREIVIDVKRGVVPPLRPKVPKNACSISLYEQMEKCWEEDPTYRPTFAKVKDTVGKLGKRGGRGIVDHLLRKMEQYTSQLEEEAMEKMQQFMDEKERSDNLLKHMLPRAIAGSLTRGETILPETFQSVTILFSDIVGFSDLTSTVTPFEVLEQLNGLNLWVEAIVDHFDVYKVECVLDIFMIASGLPVRNGNLHASEVAKLAIRMRKDIHKLRIPRDPAHHFVVRIGIHSAVFVLVFAFWTISGPGSVLNVSLRLLDLVVPPWKAIPNQPLPSRAFGDSVNTASRMQSTGEGMKIQITDSTKELLDEVGGFITENRGQVLVKGKGEMVTCWLKGALLADT